MTKRKSINLIRQAYSIVTKEIAMISSRGTYASALASEGYAGGYRDALDDVLLLIRAGCVPERRHYWTGLEVSQKPPPQTTPPDEANAGESCWQESSHCDQLEGHLPK